MKAMILAGVGLAALAGTTSAQQLRPGLDTPTIKPTTPPKPAKPDTGLRIRSAPTSNTSALAPNDNCATPDNLVGPGPYPFDTTGATTGAQGQAEGICLFFGSMAIINDIWLTWTAPATGVTTVSLCPGSGTIVDSKFAVYAGAGCPGAGALACNDDSCGLISQLTFNATMGNVYTIQIGNYGGTPVGTPGTGTLTITPPGGGGGNDNCATPTALVGPGPYPATNVGSTTGAEGQAEAICNFFGSPAIANDVWYTWVAPASGLTVVSLCPGPGSISDPKLAAYNGSGCPAGAAIACNDDQCGLTSEISFNAVASQTYTFQLGNYPLGGASPGTATFTITQPPPGGPGEGCGNPFNIVGFGSFPFDNTAATTDTQFGCTMERDFWYLWNAPVSGSICINTCGQTGIDSKIAVYNGATCGSPILACVDDACGLQTVISFAATSGNDYLIQLGSFPGSGGGPGTFTIQAPATYTGCRYDDGSSEDAVGGNLGVGSGVLWIHGFGQAGDSTVVSSVSSAYGTPVFPGSAPPNGTPVLAGIWNDPTNDYDPSDCVLLATAPGTVQNVDTDILSQIDFNPPVVTSGVYFVGVGLQLQSSPSFMAPVDTSCVSSGGRAWIVGTTNGTPVNYNNLAANGIPPIDEDDILPGVWLLRADCTAKNSVTPFCFGDGTGFPCPCGNNGSAGRGCENSAATGGGLLSGAGNASVSADTLVITASSLRPSALGVLFQSSAADGGHAFGDGVSCLQGTLKRLYKKSAVAGVIVMPSGLDLSVSAASAAKGDPLSAGSLRNLGLAYRDPAAFCNPPPATFNGTNMLRVVWGP